MLIEYLFRVIRPMRSINSKSGQQACFDALRSGGCGLRHLTPAQRTDSCCRLALVFDPKAWRAIPQHFKNRDTLISWVCHGLYKNKIYQGIPKNVVDLSFYRGILICEPSMATKEPDIFINGIQHFGDELIDMVLSYAPEFFEYIDESQRNYERCLLIVSRWSMALKYVPENLKNSLLCQKALEYSQCLQYVPSHLLNEEMVNLALEHSPRLQYVPSHLLNEKMVRLALEHLNRGTDESFFRVFENEDIARIPTHLFTEDICQQFLLADFTCIGLLPQDLITKAMCLEALKDQELMGFMLNEFFNFVPEHIRDEVHKEANFTYHVQPGER
jgi:hypothetical protein